MDFLDVTLAIVPRERFSFSQRSLESILANTPPAVQMIYVDGNAPEPVRNYINATCAAKDIRLIRKDEYLSPNVARNLAVAGVRSKYVVFIDNDVLVTPGWLTKLVRSAEENNAWAVGPLYCQGEPAGSTIHMAGGTAHFYEKEGLRFFHEAHTLCGQSTERCLPTLSAGPVELLEFHTMLLRTDTFHRFGKLDEEYMSVHEHVDICLKLRQAGLSVFMEPESVTTYVGPPPLADYDREYFSLRWCDAWNRISMQHFQEKWVVSEKDPGLQKVLEWASYHRCKALQAWQSWLRPLGRKRALRLIAACEAPISRNRFRLDECLPGHRFSGGRNQTGSSVTAV